MNKLATLALAMAFSFAGASGADLKELQPEMGQAFDFTAEKAAQYSELTNALKRNNFDTSKLTPLQRKLNDEIGDRLAYGEVDTEASWTPASVAASSSLKPSGSITYSAKNANNYSYLDAWVEGVAGYGIGEYLVYAFKPAQQTFNRVYIANGYVKSEKAYKDNSRVKKLKMYVNDTPIAILCLKDVRQLQSFDISQIDKRFDGTAPFKEKGNFPEWKIKFEIMEVYKGDKYDDTAISELYMSGPYYCFAAGTKILMADNSLKNIEQIKAGDMVKSYNFANKTLVNSKVAKLISVAHFDLHKLKFGGKEIIATADHPFWIERNAWAAVNAEKANKNYHQETAVESLKAGDKIFIPESNSFAMLAEMQKIEGSQTTYTIELSGNGNFIANGALAKTEMPK